MSETRIFVRTVAISTFAMLPMACHNLATKVWSAINVLYAHKLPLLVRKRTSLSGGMHGPKIYYVLASNPALSSQKLRLDSLLNFCYVLDCLSATQHPVPSSRASSLSSFLGFRLKPCVYAPVGSAWKFRTETEVGNRHTPSPRLPVEASTQSSTEFWSPILTP